MPTQTYTPIARQVLATGTTTVTFSSIPSTYTDLVLIINAGTNVGYSVRLNGDSGSNYSFTRLYGDGASAVSDRGSNTNNITSGWGGGTNNLFTVQIMNYSNTNTNKTALTRINDNSYTVAIAGLWRNTAAVNEVSIIGTANYAVGSTFTLYGIKAGS
jgi:hypothetical protein